MSNSYACIQTWIVLATISIMTCLLHLIHSQLFIGMFKINIESYKLKAYIENSKSNQILWGYFVLLNAPLCAHCISIHYMQICYPQTYTNQFLSMQFTYKRSEIEFYSIRSDGFPRPNQQPKIVAIECFS